MSQKMLKCSYCNSDLKLTRGFTGADYNCKKGKGSCYDYELSLDCTNPKCGISNIIGYTKGIGDFSEVVGKYRCYR